MKQWRTTTIERAWNEAYDLLSSAPETDAERERRVFTEFLQRDAEPQKLAIQDVFGKRLSQCNIEVTVPGKIPRPPIYLTAHHDHDPRGTGVVDNWSGVVALIALYDRFVAVPLQRPLVLVSFALEEFGEYGSTVGSRHYVQRLLDQAVHANVNLECLGPGPVHYWTYEDTGIPVPRNVPQANYHGLPSDARSFYDILDCPAIVFDGIAAISDNIIHTARDTIDAIDRQHYERSLDQIENYVRMLDSWTADRSYRNRRPTRDRETANSHESTRPMKTRTLRVRREITPDPT